MSIFRGVFVQQLIRQRFPLMPEDQLNEILQSEDRAEIAVELIRILDLLCIHQISPSDRIFDQLTTMASDQEPFTDYKSAEKFKQKLLNLKIAFEQIPSDTTSDLSKWFEPHPNEQFRDTLSKYWQLKVEMIQKIDADVENISDLVPIFQIQTSGVKDSLTSLHSLFVQLIETYRQKNPNEKLYFSKNFAYDFDSSETPKAGAPVVPIKLLMLAKAMFNLTISADALRMRIKSTK